MKGQKQTNTLRVIGPPAILLTVCLIVFGIVFFKEWNKPTLVARGTITLKQTSCGKEVLLANGSTHKEGGLCDSGNYIDVAGVHIFTGGGRFEPSNRTGKIVDISSFHAGDRVEVRYIIDERNGPSTNCHRCNIKKID